MEVPVRLKPLEGELWPRTMGLGFVIGFVIVPSAQNREVGVRGLIALGCDCVKGISWSAHGRIPCTLIRASGLGFRGRRSGGFHVSSLAQDWEIVIYSLGYRD